MTKGKPGGPFFNKASGLCNVTAYNAAPTPFGAIYSTPWDGVDFAMRSTSDGESWAMTPLDSDRPKTSGKTGYGTMMAHGAGGCETAAAPTIGFAPGGVRVFIRDQFWAATAWTTYSSGERLRVAPSWSFPALQHNQRAATQHI